MALLQQSLAFFAVLIGVFAKQDIDVTAVPASDRPRNQSRPALVLPSFSEHPAGLQTNAVSVEDLSAPHGHDASILKQPLAQDAKSRRRRIVIYQGQAGALQLRQTNVVGNLSLLMAANGPLAFHSGFEPVATRSLLGRKSHAQQLQAVTSPMDGTQSRSGTESRRRRIVIYQGQAGSLHQRQTNWTSNVSLLADVVVPSALSFEPTAMRSLLGSKAYTRLQAVTSPRHGTRVRPDTESRHQRIVIHQGTGRTFQKRQAHAGGNISFLAGSDGPLAFHSSFEPVATRTLLGRKAHSQELQAMMSPTSAKASAEVLPLPSQPDVGAKIAAQSQVHGLAVLAHSPLGTKLALRPNPLTFQNTSLHSGARTLPSFAVTAVLSWLTTVGWLGLA